MTQPTEQPPSPYALPPQYQQRGNQTHLGALWSMILGIIGVASGVLALPFSGLTTPGLLCSPVAFGLGFWASRKIADEPGVYNNRGHAIAGWILGLVGMVIALLLVLAVLAFVGLVLWVFSESGA